MNHRDCWLCMNNLAEHKTYILISISIWQCRLHNVQVSVLRHYIWKFCDNFVLLLSMHVIFNAALKNESVWTLIIVDYCKTLLFSIKFVVQYDQLLEYFILYSFNNITASTSNLESDRTQHPTEQRWLSFDFGRASFRALLRLDNSCITVYWLRQ